VHWIVEIHRPSTLILTNVQQCAKEKCTPEKDLKLQIQLKLPKDTDKIGEIVWKETTYSNWHSYCDHNNSEVTNIILGFVRTGFNDLNMRNS
jgi:hypothetical protein